MSFSRAERQIYNHMGSHVLDFEYNLSVYDDAPYEIQQYLLKRLHEVRQLEAIRDKERGE